MKYRVTIPQPKAKRMIGKGRLFVSYLSGFSPEPREEISITLDQTEAEFEVPDGLPWLYETKEIGGSTFAVILEYQNESGSRAEKYNLVPGRVI